MLFVKNTFTPDWNIKMSEAQNHMVKIVAIFTPSKINTDLFHQIDDYIQSKQKLV
jgi:hypothetical protein